MRDTPLEFDITDLAPNGLRRGRTTGTCATAAVTAALTILEDGAFLDHVWVKLPDGLHVLKVPIESVELVDEQCATASVIKDAGDDPDHTHGAAITAHVRRNDLNETRFFAGPGVGTVTAPGIRVPIGEPAINPVPRSMILESIKSFQLASASNTKYGYDLTIGCCNGDQIAKRTFNPRLGIVGGISILGTTGIVEPMSLSAYMASIEVYIRVAAAENNGSIAFLPGNLGITFAKGTLGLNQRQIVHISNFIGFSLEKTDEILRQTNSDLRTLWLLGHPGKLAKMLGGTWDTHSRHSNIALQDLIDSGRRLISTETMPIEFSLTLEEASTANTTEEIIERLAPLPSAHLFWKHVEHEISMIAHSKVPIVDRVDVRLYSMNGTPLGESA